MPGQAGAGDDHRLGHRPSLQAGDRAPTRCGDGNFLGALLGLGTVSEQDLYAALDWLLSQQPRIERELARKHLNQGTLVLYDVTSSYFEGRTCPLAQYGYSRDGKRDKLQILLDRKSTRLNSSHRSLSRMPSSA